MAVTGAITFSNQEFRDNGHRPIRKVTFDWTSDASAGSVGEIPTPWPVSGTIMRVVTNPGSTAPTDNYDVTLLDPAGIDVFAGQGADRDTTNSEHFKPGIPIKDGTTTGVDVMVVDDILTLTIANAGNSKVGQVIVYLR